MRVLILGGTGMLGHRLLAHLEGRGHEVRATVRSELSSYPATGPLRRDNTFENIDLRDGDGLLRAVSVFAPQAIVNCAGIVKQRREADDPLLNIQVNSLLPHRVALLCREGGARLVHISTDCVFSGARGGYTEQDTPDAVDLYDRSKLLGEVAYAPAITLRTSMIGLELAHNYGLIEWFLAQRGSVKGFRRAIFSGLTTSAMSEVIEGLLGGPALHGIYHVSAEPISKHALLCALRDALGLKIDIVPCDEPLMDRSLDSTRFRQEFGYNPPSWQHMISSLAAEIRGRRV
jgi:dTDP-4-dehydrorhamnose reductase